MKKLSVIVKYLSLISFIFGIPFVAAGVFFELKQASNEIYEMLEFCMLMLMVITTILGAFFEGLMGEEKAYSLSKFTPFYLALYLIFLSIGIWMITSGNVITALMSAGVINTFKLFDLSRKYIINNKNTGDGSMCSN